MQAGGHVLLAGSEIATTTIDARSFVRGIVYPIIFRYELDGDQDGTYVAGGNDVGHYGVGEESFVYRDCCLNVLDIAYVGNPITSVRRPPHQPTSRGCPVDMIRDHDAGKDGLRKCAPIDAHYSFPLLELRPEVASSGKVFHSSAAGLWCDVYNPPYFAEICDFAEATPPRTCFEPMYALHCRNLSSKIYGAPVAYWTSAYEDRVPAGGVAARSAVWGFHPVYFEPAQVKQAIAIILHNEWQLPRVP